MSTETAHERFLRIGASRKKKVVEAIDTFTKMIGRGPPHYEWSDEEAVQVLEELDLKMKELRAAFKLPETTVLEKTELTKEDQPEPKLCRATVAWAYDKLRSGRIDDAKGLLKVVLQRSKQ